MSAAPLKRDVGDQLIERWVHHFRARMSAAPLKRRLDSPARAKNSRFPRSNERGPVEARTWFAPGKTRASFPRSNERGPVEADQAYD